MNWRGDSIIIYRHIQGPYIKIAIILPTGQWYAPSAVINDAWWGIMANMVLCVIPGQGNSKILNLVKSGSFDSPIFLYIPNDEKTSTGHLI